MILTTLPCHVRCGGQWYQIIALYDRNKVTPVKQTKNRMESLEIHVCQYSYTLSVYKELVIYILHQINFTQKLKCQYSKISPSWLEDDSCCLLLWLAAWKASEPMPSLIKKPWVMSSGCSSMFACSDIVFMNNVMYSGNYLKITKTTGSNLVIASSENIRTWLFIIFMDFSLILL